MRKIAPSVATLLVMHLTVAHAYIGPGLGAGVIAVVLGILSSVFFAIVGILWYPIKRILKSTKRSRPNLPPLDQDTHGPDTRSH